MSAITIEEGGIAALDDVMMLMNEAFDAGYGEAWNEGQTLAMLAMPGVWLLLARIDGRPAGFALNRIIAGEVELLLLAVAPACRRVGVGMALIGATIAQTISRDGDRVHLEVRHNNPAIELYRKAGFTVVGRRSGYYRGNDGQLFDALTLSRSVDER